MKKFGFKNTIEKITIWIQNRGKYFFKYSKITGFLCLSNKEILFIPNGVENDTL